MSAEVIKYTIECARLLSEIESIKEQIKGLSATAKKAGVNVKAMRKAAKELITDSDKLAMKYEDEAQLDMFRAACGILKRKGLEPAMLDAAE